MKRYEWLEWAVPAFVVFILWVFLKFIDGRLAESVWGVQVHAEWKAVATGWNILYFGWPLIIIGAVTAWYLRELLHVGLYELTRGRYLIRRMEEERAKAKSAQRNAEDSVAHRENHANSQMWKAYGVVETLQSELNAKTLEMDMQVRELESQLLCEQMRVDAAEQKLKNTQSATRRRSSKKSDS